MLCCTAAILCTINLHQAYLFFVVLSCVIPTQMVKQISCVTSHCGNRCKPLSTQNTCLVNIILLVAEIIPDN